MQPFFRHSVRDKPIINIGIKRTADGRKAVQKKTRKNVLAASATDCCRGFIIVVEHHSAPVHRTALETVVVVFYK